MSLEETSQYATFKDCLARRLLLIDSHPGSSSSSSPAEDQLNPEDLSEFVDYLSSEIYPFLPSYLYTASPENVSSIPITADDISPETLPLLNIPSSFSDSLISYGYCSPDSSSTEGVESSLDLLRLVIKDYLAEVTAPRTPWKATRTTECEICEREVPLTYHHLIPKGVHDKVRKKGWHPEHMLNSVAWLCR
jgi:hypothetical protein